MRSQPHPTRHSPALITDVAVRHATARSVKTKADEWLSDPAPRGAGRFVIRCTAAGSSICMFRYTTPDGKRATITMGVYDSSGTAGLTLKAAREKAGALSRKYADGATDLRGTLAAERVAQAAQREVQQREQEDRAAHAVRGSLQRLMEEYCLSLGERPAAREARGLFKLHVTAAYPALVARPAADVSARDFRDVLKTLIDADKGRTAAKLRSYLRAAYQAGLRADLDPAVPGSFLDFRITVNPLDALPSLSQYSRARHRTLTRPEIRAFWRRLHEKPESVKADAVKAAILLGGQRPHQLLRATLADVDLSGRTLTLHDVKGRDRHANPRRHVLPIVDALLPLMERRITAARTAEAADLGKARANGEKRSAGSAPLFTTDGETPLREETAAKLVATIRDEMQAGGELDQGHFTLADLRRTAETRMAELGVSRDVRAQIQSHGLGGIQARHYDRHDYMAEKRDALRLWERLLTSPSNEREQSL
jgi:hypothetical protein